MFYLNLLILYSLWCGERSLVVNETVYNPLCEQLYILSSHRKYKERMESVLFLSGKVLLFQKGFYKIH